MAHGLATPPECVAVLSLRFGPTRRLAKLISRCGGGDG